MNPKKLLQHTRDLLALSGTSQRNIDLFVMSVINQPGDVVSSICYEYLSALAAGKNLPSHSVLPQSKEKTAEQVRRVLQLVPPAKKPPVAKPRAKIPASVKKAACSGKLEACLKCPILKFIQCLEEDK